MISVLIGIILGCFSGIVTGVIPGIHINLVASFLIFFAFSENSLFWICFITAMAVSHNFFEFIPALLLNIPEDGSELASAKTSSFLYEGRIIEALKLTSIGSLGALLLCMVALFFLSETIKFLQLNLKQFVKMFLIFISANMIFADRPKQSFFVFMLSGVLGFAVLTNDLLKQPLLALLTGLFGLSSVISNISKKVDFPKQMKNVAVDIKRSVVVKSLFSGVLASVILGFVPGLGPSQASYISTSISKNKT
ncbi:MAG: tripartite tricarboxylate transporter permease, partial [Candidatus Nanoarchaeia archaeon]|nr:tripartite tricarboxylate transporter permease [Candidatus Nanoarchaeia archaeon]